MIRRATVAKRSASKRTVPFQQRAVAATTRAPPTKVKLRHIEEEKEGDEGNVLLKPHGLQWTVGEVETDLVDLPKLRPKLLWGIDLPRPQTEINYFWLMYPHEHVQETIEATSANLRAFKQPVLTLQEWFCFLGIVIAMPCYGGLSRDLLWSKERVSPLDPALNFGQWMKRKRLNMILRALQFAQSDEPVTLDGNSEDNQNGLSSTAKEKRPFQLVRSTRLCVDESVNEWRGRDGCPHVTKIVRKLKGVGVEIKNLADVETGYRLLVRVCLP